MKVLVNSPVADVRIEPDQRSELHSQALLGDIVQVQEKKQRWYLCKLFDGSSGWIHCGYLVEKDDSLQKYSEGDLLIVSSMVAHVFSEPTGNSAVIRPLSAATKIANLRYQKSWYEVEMPDGVKGWVYSHFVSPVVSSSQYTSKLLVDYSHRMMGIPYLWGGTSSFAFDCSGFTQLLHRMFNIMLPRNASQQEKAMNTVAETMDFDQFKSGDLLFFSEGKSVDHVGIYTGNGSIIHASMNNGQVKTDNLRDNENRYSQRLREMFVNAGRIDPR